MSVIVTLFTNILLSQQRNKLYPVISSFLFYEKHLKFMFFMQANEINIFIIQSRYFEEKFTFFLDVFHLVQMSQNLNLTFLHI